MSQAVFGTEYAAAYDALYRDKDYAAECVLIERVFAELAGQPVERVLDLGCGTGGHAVPLAERGYDVVGIDRSPAMLSRAKARASAVRFELGDIRSVELPETFEAVLMMFAVLGYQSCNADVQAALATARRHLRSGGLLFGDVWYGPAVLAQRPSERVKVMQSPDGGEVIRVASSDLNSLRSSCTVRYRLWRIADGRVKAEVGEEHPMRYFFAPELELFLTHAGFELVRIGGFPDFEVAPSELTWNVAFAARAM
jgi:SAM-dependent methyltransferase